MFDMLKEYFFNYAEEFIDFKIIENEKVIMKSFW